MIENPQGCAFTDCGRKDCPVCKWSRPGMPGNREVQIELARQAKEKKKGNK